MIATSGGGHWVQMRRLLPALEGCTLSYVGVYQALDPDLGEAPYYQVRDVSRTDPLGFVVIIWQLWTAIRREQPDVVISTGAAPGLMAILMAKLLRRSRAMWIDSIANTEELSLSGRLARRMVDAWLVQWPHLASPDGPEYWGAVF
jgi:UDP-N-acetylglucosamine:LPS N-acetylglucosamine transferase